MRTITRSGIVLLERTTPSGPCWSYYADELVPNFFEKYTVTDFWSGAADGDLQPSGSNQNITPLITDPYWSIATP